MEPLPAGERAALAKIINSGRAAVEVEIVATPGDDGRRVLTGHGRISAEAGGFVGHVSIGDGDRLDAQTAEGLRARGLVEVWPVGIVKVIDHDKRKKGVRPAILATLTPYAARALGVKLQAEGGVLRWAETGEAGEPAEIVPDAASPYPEPLPELDRLPPARRRSKGRR